MKKALTALCTALLVVVFAFAFAGCSVEGNKYEYESYTVDYDDKDISEDGKKLLEGAITLAITPFKAITYEFEKDGVVKVTGIPGKYEQDGNEVTINGVDKLTASGSKLKRIVKKDSFSLVITYKKV